MKVGRKEINLFNIDEKLRYNKLYQWTKDKIRNTKYGTGNLVRWLPVIWTDRCWDSYFIYALLHKKLSMMEKHFREDGHHMDAIRDADKIKVCLLLIKRIIDDEYTENALKHHDEKWGDTEISFSPDRTGLFHHSKVITEEDEVSEVKDFRRAMEVDGVMRKQDIELLFSMLKKHIASWWD